MGHSHTTKLSEIWVFNTSENCLKHGSLTPQNCPKYGSFTHYCLQNCLKHRSFTHHRIVWNRGLSHTTKLSEAQAFHTLPNCLKQGSFEHHRIVWYRGLSHIRIVWSTGLSHITGLTLGYASSNFFSAALSNKVIHMPVFLHSVHKRCWPGG